MKTRAKGVSFRGGGGNEENSSGESVRERRDAKGGLGK